jgi:hypothetical protein
VADGSGDTEVPDLVGLCGVTKLDITRIPPAIRSILLILDILELYPLA